MKSYTRRLALALGLFVAQVSSQGQEGSGVEAEGAGEITGVPAPGSTVTNPQIDILLFRPTCILDEDCASGVCENDRNDENVQDIDDIFYCGNPQGDEDCQTVADNVDPGQDLFEIQRFDGICNNLNPDFQLDGSLGALQLRRMNGVPLNVEEELSGAPESIIAREISDDVMNEISDIPNQFGSSTLLAYAGQMIDHDITLIEFQPADTRITIEGSGSTGDEIVFELSVLVEGSEPILNPNSATSWIDLSMVYGSDIETAYNLRRPFNMAQLDFTLSQIGSREGTFMFLPRAEELSDDDRFVTIAMSPAVDNLFAAGDLRINEQVMLTSWHTLFLREHNRLYSQTIQPANDDLECPPQSAQEQRDRIIPGDCEFLFQMVRRVNIAQWQQIVFSEYFSAWHNDNQDQDGEFSLTNRYEGYNDSVSSGIDIFFSTASYRFGHTILRTYIVEKGAGGEDPFNSLFLGNAFFNPSQVLARNGISGLLNGAANQCGARRDQRVSSGIRNFLFGNIPGSEFVNSDLIAFNIERGRDHQIALYNDARTFFELEPLNTFEEVVTVQAPANFETPECVIDDLNEVFGEDEVDNMDPFVGMLVEPSAFGQIGETMFKAQEDQFWRFLVADRFYFGNLEGPTLPLLERAGFSVANIRDTSLADVLNRNTFDNAIVIDEETGLTQEDGQRVFSAAPFLAPTNGEGECCVNDGDTELTPVCFRNQTNFRSFFREDVSACDANQALINLDAGGGAGAGFIAGTMLPTSFESYNCNCNLYSDQEQTAFFVIALQDRPESTDEIIAQLLLDIERLTGEIASERMPEEDMQIFATGTQIQIRASCSPTDDTDSFMSCQSMIGAMEAAIVANSLGDDPNAIMTAEFMQVTCVDCPLLPSDFEGLSTGADAASTGTEATLLGLSVAAGGAVIGGIAVVALIILGCGFRSYSKSKNRQQTFTSGQESV